MRLIANAILAGLLLASLPANAATVRDWRAGEALMIDIDTGQSTRSMMRNDGDEIYFQFSGPLGGAAELDQLALKYPNDLRSVRSGFDSLVIAAARQGRFQAWTTPQGVRIAFTPAAGLGATRLQPDVIEPAADQAAAERRLQVLRGRVELATGRPEAAVAALQTARAQNPDDPETLAALAAAETELGRPGRALAYLDQAIASRPDDPDLARDRARLARDTGSYVEAFAGYRDTDDSDDVGTGGVRMAVRYGQRWRVAAEGVISHLDAPAVQRVDGRVTPVEKTFGRGQASVAYAWTPDHETSATLYGAAHGPGVGLAHRAGPQTARTTAAVTIGEPYHDEVAGIADRGRRHSVALGHERRFDANWSAGVSGGLNQYGVRGDENVSRTASATLNVRRRLYNQAPFYVDAGYGVDAEYVIEDDERRDTGGAIFTPLGIEKREVHFGDVSATATVATGLSVSGTLGYGIDRFGGDGMTAAGSLNWEPSPDWKLGVSASRSFAATRGDNDTVTNFGFYVRRRIGAPLQAAPVPPADSTPNSPAGAVER